MKTNHEMLKEICDEIGYEISTNDYFWYDDNYKDLRSAYGESKKVNEREIIFTVEFIDKFTNTFLKLNGNLLKTHQDIDNILLHLDNPTLYLYNTLGLGQKKENN